MSSADNAPLAPPVGAAAQPRRRYRPLPLERVVVNDAFWAQRQQANREQTLAHIYEQCRLTGRLDAFRADWRPAPALTQLPAGGATPVMFWDSDVAKWIEAASYSLATHPDPQLDAQLDALIALIAQAQHPDGYLNSWFTHVAPQGRWTNLRDWHELYDAGHLIEAGVAHFQATGKRTLLAVVARYADHIAAQFGIEPDKRRGYCGHPEIELALVKLARATGEPRYLALSRYFVNERGQQPHYFDHEVLARGDDPARFWARSYEYNQSHRPVREQDEVVGHAVRAMYLYSAMADLAAEDGDAALLAACQRLWQHLTTRRMYLTGGIGVSAANEGFTSDYDLPNSGAYAETCAAIGLVFWAQRMLQLECDRRYSDTLERALYNAVLSGGSLAGTAFFYDDPLASEGAERRQGWFDCPCCPPNLARMIASLGAYVYAQGDNELLVHLFVQSEGRFALAGRAVRLRQETSYPWQGTVTLRVDVDEPASFMLRIRIPGWCRAPRVAINGEAVDLAATLVQGYARIARGWQSGDLVTIELPMPVERIYAHPAVAADAGRVALQRGPLIYCLEQADQAIALQRILLPMDAELRSRIVPDLLGGVVVIEGQGLAVSDDGWQEALYRTAPPAAQPCALYAIPYYAWNNRGPGAMAVWLRE